MMTKKWVGVTCALLMAGVLLCAPLLSAPSLPRESYAKYRQDIAQGVVKSVRLDASAVMAVTLSDGTTYQTDNPRRETLKEELLTAGIAVEEGSAAAEPSRIIGFMLAGALVVGAYKAFSREKTAVVVKEAEESKKNTTFADVAGNREAVDSLRGLVDYLQDPEKYKKLGARLPRGVLLYGPPGTGKTLMAKALAGEAGVPFLYASGSDFVQMYVGMGASRVRELFKRARKNGRCVVFIDEIDALGKSRASGEGDNGERDQTLNALLTEMSGFEGGEGILVVAATNRRDTLDEALLRPGRFDRHVEVGMPDRIARERIIEVVSRRMPLGEVCIADIARRTVGFSGAALESMMNEAAIVAARQGSLQVTESHIDNAYFSSLVGDEREIALDARDRRITAIHEAGHALACRRLLPEDAVQHVTIIPATRGSGGHMLRVPAERMQTKMSLRASVQVALAGRAAEEVTFGQENISVGAANDLDVATRTLEHMVCRLGMDEEAGLATRSEKDGSSLVQKRMQEYYRATVALIRENEELLLSLAAELEAKETLSGEQVDQVLTGTGGTRTPNEPPPRMHAEGRMANGAETQLPI